MSNSNTVPEDSIEKKLAFLEGMIRSQQQLLACILSNSADRQQIVDDFRESSARQQEVLQAEKVLQGEDAEAHALASAVMLRDLEHLSASWKE